MSIRVNVLYDILFSLLLISLTLSTAVPNILFGCLIGLYFYRIFYLKEKCNYDYIKRKHLILVCLLAFQSINIFIINNGWNDFNMILRFLIFLILPILLLKVNQLELLKLSFISGINLGLFFSLFLILSLFISEGIIPFGNTIYVNQILMIERPYLGFMCAISLVLSASLLPRYSCGFIRWYLFFSCFFAVALIVVISARMSLISLLVVVIYFLLVNRKVYHIKSVVSAIILTGILVLIFGNNILNRFYINKSLEKSIEKAMIYEPRFTIWECSLAIIRSDDFNYLLGMGGYTNVQKALDICYSSTIENKSKREYYLDEGFNSHNQFLDFLLVGGVFSLVLFLWFFGSFFYETNFKINVFGISILIIYVLFFSVENVLHRQLGCYLFGLIYFLVNNEYEKCNNKGIERN